MRSAVLGAGWRLACVAMLLATTMAGGASAAPIELAVFTGTGQAWLYNPNPTASAFVYYSLSSASGALNPADGVWTSIADTYDSSWTELSASNTMLAEGTFAGSGVVLPAAGALSLGTIWSPAAGIGDLSGQLVESTAAVSLPIVYTMYDSDFDFDADVDRDDLAIWRANLGTGTLHTEGDADWDGDVDGDDFLQWQRDSVVAANEAAGAGADLETGASALWIGAVPEPGTVWLLCVGAGMALAARRSLAAFE